MSWRTILINDKNKKHYPLVPYPTIVLATMGDIEAIRKVLDHYSGYIMALSTRKLIDQYGNTFYAVDEDLRKRIECKLVEKILLFKI
ncbi:helix-turn-helix domain-containing protein [Listeria costaricensis]|uniref:helix-turn-helix domain-containing protein n=1 Tax=Listeria costaricensis TaxID=2026604 RepID=UPI0013C46399|nr:helix-turn-helix domain-containing protein [Listeria costaricensis]